MRKDENKPVLALIKQINDEMARRGNNAMRPYGVTMAQFDTLMFLREDGKDGELPFKDIERRLHVAQSTCVGIISRLQAKGFVSTSASSKDRRTKTARITEAGIRVCDETQQDRRLAEEDVLGVLDEKERTELRSILGKIASALA